MNKLLLSVFALLFSAAGFTQANVVQWKFESKKVDDKKYEVKLIAVVQDSWHIYSINTPDGGPQSKGSG